jgi:hypothetical protein
MSLITSLIIKWRGIYRQEPSRPERQGMVAARRGLRLHRISTVSVAVAAKEVAPSDG